jgi:hypothetical protein
VSEQQLETFFGPPNGVNIYTGEITFVGETHIEYDINSFKGCSGAVVFLLDKNQPTSVRPLDYGTAVAVHAGAHPTMVNRNVAFKLSEALLA